MTRLFSNPFFAPMEGEDEYNQQQHVLLSTMPSKTARSKSSGNGTRQPKIWTQPSEQQPKLWTQPSNQQPKLWTQPSNQQPKLWTKPSSQQSKLWTQPSQQLPSEEPQQEANQAAVQQHLANMQKTRSKVQAGAQRLEEIRAQAKEELRACKNVELIAEAREFAAARSLEDAIRKRGATLDKIRKHTRALKAAEALLQQHEADLTQAATDAAYAQLQTDQLRHRARLASAKAKELSRAARLRVDALEGGQQVENELTAAYKPRRASGMRLEDLWTT